MRPYDHELHSSEWTPEARIVVDQILRAFGMAPLDFRYAPDCKQTPANNLAVRYVRDALLDAYKRGLRDHYPNSPPHDDKP